MIDFHSHIVYGVDDGAETIEDSIRILKLAQNAGFKKIILTPHYMQDYYEIQKDEIKQKIELIEEKCKEENIDISLYQANEIYITNHMTELLQEGIVSSINNSKYVLFELPMNEEPANLLEVVYSLLENGKTPIIAHPERYTYVQKNPNKLLELIEKGVLFQTNYGSILGQYGKEIQKTANLLLENNFIHFLGSDVHRIGHIYEKIEEIKKQLRKIISEEKIEELTDKNIEKILKDEKIEIEEPSKIKQGFFKKFSFSIVKKIK